MQKKKKLIRSAWMRKLLRLHIVITVLSFGVYFSVAFFDPGFLSYDLRQKYHALADDLISVTATVLAPPVQPVVIGATQCDEGASILSVTLDWADDVNTYTYDIDRDSQPLVTGIALSDYIDTAVTLNTSYTYVVTAHGPMGSGFAISLPITIMTLGACGTLLPPPVVHITSFDGRSVSSYNGMPSVTERRPVFTGTTNMSSAIIQIVTGPADSFIAEFTANSNGYWEWRPPVSFALETQTFTVTAIDPNDSSRQKTTSLEFKITRKNEDSGGAKNKKTIESVVGSTTRILALRQAPLDFSLAVENSDATVLQGQDLQAVLRVMDIAKQYAGMSVLIRYSILDKSGDSILSITKETLLQKGIEVKQSLSVPLYVAVGEYSLRAEILFDKINVSRIAKFSVAALPILQLGGGTMITYAEIIRNLGWITFLLITLLLLWLLMFIREYWLYLHAARHIAEQQLRQAGFFGKRKGVAR